MTEEKLIGHISHFFGKIGVGIIELSAGLNVGDKIHVLGAHTDFEQNLDSMQINHEDISSAKAGDSVGIKFSEPIREGDKVFLL